MNAGFFGAAERPPAFAREAMVATSQPLATRAGLRVLEEGGNAADAALAAAAVLAVTEPMMTGIGGDAFALVWRDGTLAALDAAGPAPAEPDRLDPVDFIGPRSVTVPGAVAGWAALSERFGKLGLDRCLHDAIDAAERGFAVGARCAATWALDPDAAPEGFTPIPHAGALVRLPELGASLRRIAEHGPAAFYRGPIAEAMAAASWLAPEDLARFEPSWVEPLVRAYRGVEVVELPPPTQGVVALEGLALLEELEPTLANRAACARLALEDGLEHVRDGADVTALLSAGHLAARRGQVPGAVSEAGGSTVYLCTVDGDRMAVSFVQSLFAPFGSRVVAPGTGIVLQNRGAGFAIEGRVAPGRRPFHTLLAGLMLRDGELLGPFGVMGGLIQAQAHVQLVSSIVDDGMDPQRALDRPRFRVDGDRLRLERGLDPAPFASLGMELSDEPGSFGFGGGQAIVVEGDALVGGSDSRKDGYAGGI